MELDLTQLIKLGNKGDERGGQAQNKPVEAKTAQGAYKTITNNEKPVEAKIEGLQGIHKLQRQADAKKEDIAHSLAISREYQENSIKASQLQAEILKGTRAGEDIYSLFLKAAKAVSLMTSNDLFYNQLERDIRTIYGEGLLEPIPLQMEIQQTQERLQRLREAYSREPIGSLQKAIQAHETRIADLESQLHRRQTTA